MSKLKVGDRIKFVEGGGYYCDPHGYSIESMRLSGFKSDEYAGKEAIIESITYSVKNGMDFFQLGGHGNWFSENGIYRLESTKQKLKVGDKVRLLNKHEGNSIEIGKIYTISEYYAENGDYVWKVKENDCCLKEEWLELIINEGTCTSENKTRNIMSNIKQFVKNLSLTADEKLMRKHGLKNECGEYSDDAKAIIINKLCADNEAELISIAQGLEKEAKENK